MSRLQEAIVASRFDSLADRFKESVEPDDYRLHRLARGT